MQQQVMSEYYKRSIIINLFVITTYKVKIGYIWSPLTPLAGATKWDWNNRRLL